MFAKWSVKVKVGKVKREIVGKVGKVKSVIYRNNTGYNEQNCCLYDVMSARWLYDVMSARCLTAAIRTVEIFKTYFTTILKYRIHISISISHYKFNIDIDIINRLISISRRD